MPPEPRSIKPSGSTGSYTGAGAAWSLSLSFDGGALLDFSSLGLHLNVANDLGGYDWLGLLGTGSAGTVSAGPYDFTKALFGDAGLPLGDGGYTMADFGWSDFNWASDEGTLQGMFASLSCTAAPRGRCRCGGVQPRSGPDGDGDGGGGGALNPKQAQKVRWSFALVEPQAVHAGALFYDKLFERDPSIAMLFHTGMDTQSRRLFEMIGDAVRLLDCPEQLDAVLTVLGARHVAYGVRDEHYDTVGGALLDTLDAALGAAFTPELREAWGEFYGRVSRVMREAAFREVLAARPAGAPAPQMPGERRAA